MQTLESTLPDSLWATALSGSELDAVGRESHERFLPVDSYAMRCGDAAEPWIGVIDGLIKMSVSQADGRHSAFTGVTAGSGAGEGSLLQPGPWRYDGVAARNSRLVCVPRHTFKRLETTNLLFKHFLLSHLNAGLSPLIGRVAYDRALGPSVGVARYLASLFHPVLYPRVGNCVQLSQEEVGLLSGVSRQRTNEALHELERASLLRVEFGGATVLNLTKLRAYNGAQAGSSARAA